MLDLLGFCRLSGSPGRGTCLHRTDRILLSRPTNIDPDFNHDGNADQDDIDAVLNVAGGVCP